MERVFEFFGKIVIYGGGLTAIAYTIFIFLGKKTIETWFDKRLKKFEYDLNCLFNRAAKIHEKEFEVLPIAWLKMQDALGRISGFVSIIKSWPDLDRMSETAIEEFLGKSKLHEYEKDELRKSTKKLDYYQKTIFWHDLEEVQNAFWEFHNYIIRNKIFLSTDLQAKFAEIDNIMWTAIVEMKVGKGSGSQIISQDMCINAYKKIRDEVNPIRDSIEKLVQSRLHYHEVE